MTDIKTKTEVIQSSGLGSNLGGPTSNILAEDEKSLNVQWAKRYEQLNGGASQ